MLKPYDFSVRKETLIFLALPQQHLWHSRL